MTNGIRQTRDGFVLLIVIALLGGLAYLALELLSVSVMAEKLSQRSLGISKVRLLARSGIEMSSLMLKSTLRHLDARPIAVHSGVVTLDVSPDVNGHDATVYMYADLSGRINVNDGIAAGQAEIPSTYDAKALDPWVDAASPDISALINFRLRRLLNAYGDVHKFASDRIAEGVPQAAIFPSWNTLNASHQKPVNFTCSAGGNWGASQPAGQGFGDAVISQRPQGGYRDLAELEGAVNAWGALHLHTSYLGSKSFYDVVRQDLTVRSYEDAAFFRMAREFGAFGQNPGYPLSPYPLMYALDTDPPDLTSLWRPHPVPLINLNAASFHVRAAIFYAPVNVRYLCEGGILDRVEFDPLMGPSGLSNAYGCKNMETFTPTMGVGGPCFPLGNAGSGFGMYENGVWKNVTTVGIQTNSLMSLRDAMILAGAYEAYAEGMAGSPGLIYPGGYPESFDAFAAMLKAIEAENLALPYERVPPLGTRINAGRDLTQYPHYPDDDPTSTEDVYVFRQTYIERTLPHILSCVRRMPGWLDAPAALLTPYLHPVIDNNLSDASEFTPTPLRSVDDFTIKFHIPKVDFQPGGIYNLSSRSSLYQDGIALKASIETDQRIFTTRHIRTQMDFQAMSAQFPLATNTAVVIGPEVNGSHSQLGTIGMQSSRITVPWKGHYTFSRNYLSPDDLYTEMTGDLGGVPWWPADPTVGSLVEPFVNSRMEHEESIFGVGSMGGDVSAFGGLSFSSRGHGPRASDLFGDSYIFDPLSVAPEDASLRFNKCLISFWYRVPSGLRFGHRSLFHMTLWEETERPRAGLVHPGTMESYNTRRPTYFCTYLDPYSGAVRASHSDHSSLVGANSDLHGNPVPFPWGENDPAAFKLDYWFSGVPYFLSGHQHDNTDFWAYTIEDIDDMNAGVQSAGTYFRRWFSDLCVEDMDMMQDIERTRAVYDELIANGADASELKPFEDTDGDGTLSDDEIAYAWDVMTGNRSFARAEGFTITDNDGGALSSGRTLKVPGSWQHVVVAWDYSEFFGSPYSRMWGFDSRNTLGLADMQFYKKYRLIVPSFLPYSSLVFGEIPFVPLNGSGYQGNYPPQFSSSSDSGTLNPIEMGINAEWPMPWMRLNSTIDDIQVLFWDTTIMNESGYSFFNVPGVGDSSEYIFQTIRDNPDLVARHPNHDYYYSANPGRLFSDWGPGALLISVGARIFDVPTGQGLVPEVRTDLRVYEGPAVSNQLCVPATPRQFHDYMGMIATPMGEDAPGIASPEILDYKLRPITSQTTLRLVFEQTGVGQTDDSPWVQEISLRYVTNTPRILRWHEE
ncbi:MAG: hypothetical protein AB7F75_08990 [Planctomycetota bacterium]